MQGNELACPATPAFTIHGPVMVGRYRVRSGGIARAAVNTVAHMSSLLSQHHRSRPGSLLGLLAPVRFRMPRRLANRASNAMRALVPRSTLVLTSSFPFRSIFERIAELPSGIRRAWDVRVERAVRSRRPLAQLLWEIVGLALRRVRCSPLTILLVATNALVHAWFVWWTADDSVRSLWTVSGMSLNEVLHGEWWRALTSGWIHSDWDHLLSNLTFIFVFGVLLEPEIGLTRLALVYGCSLLAGSATHMSFGALDAGGASAATFGLSAALVVTPVFADRACSRWVWLWSAYLLLEALPMGREDPTIGHSAHVVGAATGAIIAGLTAPRSRSRRRLARRWLPPRVIAASIVVGSAVLTEVGDPRWIPEYHAARATFDLARGDTSAATCRWRMVECTVDQGRYVEASLLDQASKFQWTVHRDAEEAVRLSKQIPDFWKDSRDWTRIGYLHAWSDPPDLRSAEASWLAALRESPDSGLALAGLSLLYSNPDSTDRYRPREALEAARVAVRLTEAKSGICVRSLALAHWECGERDAGIELMRLAVRLTPTEHFVSDLNEMLAESNATEESARP